MTGVQTCALPIFDRDLPPARDGATWWRAEWRSLRADAAIGYRTVLTATPLAAHSRMIS